MSSSPTQLTAAAQELALAVTFVVIPLVAYRFGDRAQDAAAKAVRESGVDVDESALARAGAKFTETRLEMVLPLAIATFFAAAGALNLRGGESGRIGAWVVEPLALLVVGLVTSGQMFPGFYLKRSFSRAADVRLHAVDVSAVVAAARHAFPWWLRSFQIARFLLATIGAGVVIVLLLT